MATLQQAEAYRSAQRDLVALSQAALVEFWRSLDFDDAVAVSAATQSFMTDLVATYGPVGAALAADYYDELREGADVSRAFQSVLAESPSAEQVQGSSRWAVGPLFAAKSDPAASLAQLGSVAQRMVQQAGRDTIPLNVTRDPANATWARMTSGKSCAFCILLSSRGAVYESAESAGAGAKWHGDCDCVQVPSWDENDLPYDPAPLFDQYLDGREKAKSGSLNDVLAGMREAHGLR